MNRLLFLTIIGPAIVILLILFLQRLSVRNDWKCRLGKNQKIKYPIGVFKDAYTTGININTISIPLVVGAFAWTYEKIGSVKPLALAFLFTSLLCLLISLWMSWKSLNLMATYIEGDSFIISSETEDNIKFPLNLATQYLAAILGLLSFIVYLGILICYNWNKIIN